MIGHIIRRGRGGDATPPITSPYEIEVTEDATQDSGGTVTLLPATLPLNPGSQWNIFRRANVQIPQGVTISAATLLLTSAASQSAGQTQTIWGEDALNSAALAATSNNTSARTRTTASAIWVVPAWSTGEQGADTTSPDLSAIIQEIVDQASWVPGNALSLILLRTDGSGGRTAAGVSNGTYDGGFLSVSWT